jgi:hypothetical protein
MLARYPVPGAAKTRLIGALGAEGAAELHRRLASRCLGRIAPLAATREASMEVRHEGGSARAMRAWLGPLPRYRPQPAGDLGARLAAAFADAFAGGASEVAVVGSDCPELSAVHVREAFARLEVADLVLGPAVDGGYYLIAMRAERVKAGHSAPKLDALFGPGIGWGGPDVLARTLEVARTAGLTVELLDQLADIDRSEDLALWERLLAEEERVRTAPRISVVIPALNEAGHVGAAVVSALTGGAADVLVVDGGSSDSTRAAARQAGARVLDSPRRGRAVQMNLGAREARGDALLFLHADCVLPADFAAAVRDVLARPGTVGGAFRFGVAGPKGPRAALIELTGAMRSWLGAPWGDQALFLRGEVFADLGGYPEIPVMEDDELARRLGRLGRVEVAPGTVRSSARAWDEAGLLRATAINIAVATGYRLGMSAERLAAWRSPVSDRASVSGYSGS